MPADVSTFDFLNPPSEPGDLGTLGHYRVVDSLGKGGMGYVFRAEDIKLKRSVALKVMNQKIASTPNSRRRFIHEARAMAAVHHDNVVTIFEVGESNKTPFMAMEMLKGSTIEKFKTGQLDFEKIIEYGRQISKGLAAAHSQGIVHRDIKPANIWIEDGNDRIKILDFGLALASTPVDHLAGRGAVIGTPGYLSPEQARSEPLDDRSDLYSLGVVLYELCTGKLPLQSKSVPGQLIAILAHRPTPVDQLNPKIPKPLCDLIQKLLMKEPRARVSTAAKLVEEFDRVEQACHAQSDMAQTLSKLQAGLSEVASQSNEEKSIFDEVGFSDAFGEPVPDPLAAAPAAAPMTLPAAKPVVKKAAPAADKPAWQAYWPIAAIVGAVLIALPIMTFAFSGAGRSDSLVVDDATPAQDLSPSVGGSPGGGSSANEQNADTQRSNQSRQGDSQDGVEAESQQNQNRGSRAGNAGGNRQPGRERGNRNRGGQQQGGQRNRDGGGDNNPNENASTLAANVAANQPTTSAGAPPSRPADTSKQDPPPRTQVTEPPPEPKLKVTTIPASFGRGADAMVQKGTSNRLGLKPSIGIGQRGGVETNHSYVRFDLANIENVKRHVKSAELVLTAVGNDRPVGAMIRVIGVPKVPLWPEKSLDWKNSFSPRGIDNLPLLAETTVTGQTDPRDGGVANIIRIQSDDLAKFIAKSSDDTITFVLAGTGPKRNSLLRFISREQSGSLAPKLIVEAPENAPEEQRNRRGR